MNSKIRWGILGTGAIAKKFAADLKFVPDANLVAIGSRASDTASKFAAKFDIHDAHESYQGLAENPNVDAVYVATPHTLHMENIILCLRAGKAVLCEKPFTINSIEANKVIRFANERSVFLMEAMWTRFLPLMTKLNYLLEKNAIGDLKLLSAGLGFNVPVNPKSRLFSPALGGGALLDIGVYAISLASMLFGNPEAVLSSAQLGPTNVDSHGVVILTYRGGQHAILYSSLVSFAPNEAVIMGTTGCIRICAPLFNPPRLVVSRRNREDEIIQSKMIGNGYSYEAEEVVRCIQDGRLESPRMPLHETLQIMETMDIIRDQWGLKYPME